MSQSFVLMVEFSLKIWNGEKSVEKIKQKQFAQMHSNKSQCPTKRIQSQAEKFVLKKVHK